MKREDMTGQTFGRLTAIRPAGQNKHGQRLWVWECECGNQIDRIAAPVKNGNTRSCGCLHREMVAAQFTTHGAKTNGNVSPEYRTWIGLRQRCLNPRNPNFKEYGERGIAVCQRWLDSFENFLADAGERPTPEHTLERKDNDGNYEPDNCRWATRLEQSHNKRNNRMLTFDGKTMCVMEWQTYLKLPVHHRIHAGWSVERALTTPVLKGINKQ